MITLRANLLPKTVYKTLYENGKTLYESGKVFRIPPISCIFLCLSISEHSPIVFKYLILLCNYDVKCGMQLGECFSQHCRQVWTHFSSLDTLLQHVEINCLYSSNVACNIHIKHWIIIMTIFQGVYDTGCIY